jgi:uncharacterized protein
MYDTLPDLAQISQALIEIESPLEAPECHGALVGLICGYGELTPQQWRIFLTAGASPEYLLAREALQRVESMRLTMTMILNQPDMSFTPLLPPDDEALGDRVEALASWCRGFLLGLHQVPGLDIDSLNQQSEAVVDDINYLAAADRYELGEQEEDEVAYSELVEYIRAAVLLILEILHPMRTLAPSDRERLH